ncbi:SMC family ATPase [Gordonia sp. ABSL1-1]|uniref:AAA family ATPase n=1 Tax=Gordonia sp. ABSL1-1 TaxID=3053923 RepID=UPI002573E059|nr:SMC family ATPase [Gordonia sp. ABSL1-1]MDL9937050.1 SMC family ATPase [Gordonia sp. ABSL1-1]
MRLHRLRVVAFGPFADETTIDFDELSGDGLFLLHGQTGAGKTTVLDAVAFALFGRVPGARDINKRLHSDHADPDQAPEVELEATIGGRRLRITRSPDHSRPKKRGTGVTKVNARGTLVWVDASGADLTRLPDIGEAVTRLLGMSAEQFFQVVLLPQGDFARFLRATSDDREVLLEKLFDTARFGDLEEWLRDRARESARTLDDRAATLDRVAQQIVALSGVPAPAEPDFDWAQGCLDTAEAAAAEATSAAEAAARGLADTQQDHDEAARRTELRRRGTQAAQRLARLDDEAATLAAVAAQLAAARRAAPIASLALEADRAGTADDRAADDCDRAAAELAVLPDTAVLADATDAELEAAIGGWAAESGRWEPLVRRALARPALVTDIDRLGGEIAAAQRRTTELTAALADAPASKEQAAQRLAAATAARAQVPTLTAERDRLVELRETIRQRAALGPQLDRASASALAARESHAVARERLLDLRERRLTGMAGELAAQLADGQPCVVCGSPEHPAPAAGAADARVGDAEEAAAARAEQVAAVASSEAQSGLAALIERRDHLDTRIGQATPEQADADRHRTEDELTAARNLAETVGDLEQRCAAIDTEIEAGRSELATIDSAQAGRRERLATLNESLHALDTEIAEATGGRVGVAERRDELAELGRRGTALRSARSAAARARAHRTDITDRLTRQCVEAGFDDVAAARAAVADDRQIEQWDAMLRGAENLRTAAMETLAEPEVSVAMAADASDVEATSTALAAARRRHDDAVRINGVATARVADVRRYVADFWNAADALAPMRARHTELAGLAELVSGRGQNARKMSLRSYVLAARLEEVLVSASVRLSQMSSGRYEFVHSDAAGPRGRRGGLGIDVRDEYTGAVRATTTLSGGETFFASLALALGLADVVAAEAGGRMLDTIFIDEGFGTLDPEALDLVMGVLDDLRSGGRVVGVVSHVDELRARIPAQLHVLRGESGSSVQLSGVVGVS